MQPTRSSVAVFTFLVCVAALAAPTPAPVRAEIDALLFKLEASGCEFNRNGNWYKGAEARSHLLRKLEYLEKRTTLRSAEQFIELAASSSSSSGQPYRVKCGGSSPQPSAQWLSDQLTAFRTSGRASGSK